MPSGPWFPVALMLIVLLSIWLGIDGPLRPGFWAALQNWQTLLGALVAVAAAAVAYVNATRSITHGERLEARRRSRKHAAIRAVLPLALAQVSDYAERSVDTLKNLVQQCRGEALPNGVVSRGLMQPLPKDTLETLAEFIEYADGVNVRVLESTVALIQIYDSRLRGIYRDNYDPSGDHVVVRTELEGRIIDAAAIYAGAAAHYPYARRHVSALPDSLSWEAVRGALRNMRLWDDEYPRLYQIVARRETRASGPFELET